MSITSISSTMRWSGCSAISHDFEQYSNWLLSYIEEFSDNFLNAYDAKVGLHMRSSSFSPTRSMISYRAARPDYLYTGHDTNQLYIELTNNLDDNNFTLNGKYSEACDSIVYGNPLYIPSRYYLPIGSKMNSQSTNIVAASFGMQYLIDLQQKAWNESKELVTYSGIDITPESFNKFKELSARTKFNHTTEYGKTLELVDDNFFIGINYNETKVPHSYKLSSAILFKEFESTFLEAFERAPKELYIDWVDSITSGGGLSTKTIPLPKNKVFHEEAYPCLNGQPLKEFIDDYLNSDSAVLLLYGPPGTGKTSLLKQIMQYANESCLITYNKDIAAMDTLFSHFYDCDERFLIIEDADTYISSRAKDGNDVMKKLLNVTDGLTARKEKKVIFTTNLTNLNDVDEALLREGRCYSTLHVDQLNIEQAYTLLDAMGYPNLHISDSIRKISLANLYSLISGRGIDQSTAQVSSGFGLGKRHD